MNTLRRFCSICMLTLVLALPTYAGEISTTVTPQPTPAPATTEGQIEIPYQAGGQISTPVAADPLVEGAFSLLQIVLTLV